MSDRVMFQQDRLTVTDSKLIVGNATIFYTSVSATSIYEGKPLIGVAFAGIAGVVPLAFMAFVFGSLFPMKAIAIMLLPMITMVIVGFSYRVQCLFVSVDGSSVPVLKSKNRFELEVAQRAIEEAKRTYEAQQKKA